MQFTVLVIQISWLSMDSVYFASWGKSTAGAILPLAKQDWLKCPQLLWLIQLLS